MACTCGHNHDRHESGRDVGYHNWKCRDCHCEYYMSVRFYNQSIKKGLLVHPDHHQRMKLRETKDRNCLT